MAKGRPLKILAPKAIAKKRQTLYDQNATESPLLRLPPEVRNRIWHFVLGGNTIHIYSIADSNPVIFAHSLCAGPRKHNELDDLAVADHVQLITTSHFPFVQPYTARHRHCNTNLKRLHPTIRLQIDLLATCAQIHREAALIPFSENTFSFAHIDPEPFLKFVMPAQARAIRSIVLTTRGFGIYQGVATASAKRKAVLRDKLPQLTSLTAFLEIESRMDALAFRDQCFAAGAGLKQTEPLLDFERLPIKRARVMACCTRGGLKLVGNRSWTPFVSREEREGWAKAVEDQLLRGWDQEAFEEQKLTRRKAATERKQALEEQSLAEKTRRRTGGKLRPMKST